MLAISRRRLPSRALALSLLCMILAPRAARAEAPAPPPSIAAFTYTKPESPEYLRTVAEEAAIMLAGAVQYANEQSNSADWDLGYDWPSFRKKLTGEAVRFDTNRFDTNMLTHPGSGALYYVAARGNRLTIAESFAASVAASTLWEYVGEFREKVSINDMIVTPIAGAAIAEAGTQLGVFFERSRRTPVTRALALLFLPTKTPHDALDGATPLRSTDVDARGLTREMGHRFELAAGGSVTQQQRGPARQDVRLALHTRVVNVPGYDAPGRTSLLLLDGNASRIDVETAFDASALNDVLLEAEVAPVAWYTQSLARDGGALRGQRLLLGGTIGFEYAAHLWDRGNHSAHGELDRISGVHAGGALVEHDVFVPPLHVRTTIAARPAFDATHALAIDAYLARGLDTACLPTVTREQGYYFAFGATLAPSLEVEIGPLAFGAEARMDSYFNIDGGDRYQEQMHDDVALHDRRTLARAWVSIAPADWVLVRLGAERRTRTGDIDGVAVRREESSYFSTVGAVF